MILAQRPQKALNSTDYQLANECLQICFYFLSLLVFPIEQIGKLSRHGILKCDKTFLGVNKSPLVCEKPHLQIYKNELLVCIYEVL